MLEHSCWRCKFIELSKPETISFASLCNDALHMAVLCFLQCHENYQTNLRDENQTQSTYLNLLDEVRKEYSNVLHTHIDTCYFSVKFGGKCIIPTVETIHNIQQQRRENNIYKLILSYIFFVLKYFVDFFFLTCQRFALHKSSGERMLYSISLSDQNLFIQCTVCNWIKYKCIYIY